MTALGGKLLKLPDSLATGDFLAYAQHALSQEDALRQRFTFAGGNYFKRMKEKDLYSTDIKKIKKRVKEAGLENIYNRAFL